MSLFYLLPKLLLIVAIFFRRAGILSLLYRWVGRIHSGGQVSYRRAGWLASSNSSPPGCREQASLRKAGQQALTKIQCYYPHPVRATIKTCGVVEIKLQVVPNFIVTKWSLIYSNHIFSIFIILTNKSILRLWYGKVHTGSSMAFFSGHVLCTYWYTVLSVSSRSVSCRS